RIRRNALDRQDAAFATELTYGTLRWTGTYDAILDRCVDRPLAKLDKPVLDALRLGAHQLQYMSTGPRRIGHYCCAGALRNRLRSKWTSQRRTAQGQQANVRSMARRNCTRTIR